MAEHIKMTAQEAKQKAEAIRKVILDTYHNEVKPSPFFTDLRAGTLSRKRLQGWIKNWYASPSKSTPAWRRLIINLSAFLNAIPIWKIASRKRSAKNSPRRRSAATRACCRFSAKRSGLREEEMIECELIPEARGLVDFFVRSWIDIPLAECYAVHMEEEIFGFISHDFRQSLPKYGITNEDMKYFRVHEEADLDEDHGGTNQAILEVALQEGYGNERAGWPLEYCGKIAVQMIGNFYDGVYRVR